MPISLTQPSDGTVGWDSAVNTNLTNIQDFVNNRRYATRYVNGLATTWISSSSLNVGPGGCRDSADAADMHLSSVASVSLASSGVNGLDTKTATGTASLSSGSKSVSGTSTVFLTDFGTRNLSAGTIGTGGVASTTVTGSGTSFLSQVAVNDLLGNSSVGYARVTSINSDTSITVSQNLTIANGSTGTVIENPTIQFTNGGTETFQVDAISSNTALSTVASAGVTHAAASVTLGAAPSVATGFFLSAWLVSGSSGTQPIASTQRTTLLNPGAGYLVSARRLASFPYLVGQIIQFYQRGVANRRDYATFPASSIATFRILSGGTATTSTNVAANPFAPPSAHTLKLTADLYQPVPQVGTAATDLSIFPRSLSTSSWVNQFLVALSTAQNTDTADYICDGGQFITYAVSQALTSGGATIDLFGYAEDI